MRERSLLGVSEVVPRLSKLIVFRYCPEDSTGPKDYGVHLKVPNSVFQQLLFPFQTWFKRKTSE
jgi:hypothetical protein